MSYLYRISFSLLVLLSVVCRAWGQAGTGQFISGEFTGVSFRQFVEQVESKTDYHFFYDNKLTDSLKVTLTVQNQSLQTVLQQVFKNTEFFFAIDGQRRVFITYGRVIQTELPSDFFDRTKESTEENTTAIADNSEQVKKEQIAATFENKLIEIGPKTNDTKTGKANLAGHVRNLSSGEPVVGAILYIENPRIGVTTDQFGYYSITLPRGRHELKIKCIGMKDTKRQLMLYADGKLNIELQDDVIPLREVVIEAEKDVNVKGMQMGLERLDIKTIRQVPTAFGEADLLKVVLTLPGVKSVGENSTGLNVRGGATSQNLILYNDAVIYNPSHLFGFFSAFNPDMVKNVELYKSGVPARYGGRLSSVLDVTSREGNKKKFGGSGGIGLITGRLTLEGPIIKDKTSFLIGARSTYSDWLLKRLRNAQFKNSAASFYDLNAHVSHDFNERNSLYITGYLSKDKFALNSDTLYSYNNQALTLKWKHVFNNKLYGVATSSYSRYTYAVSSDQNPVNAFDLKFDINQSNLKADFSYFLNPKHTLDFGASTIFYKSFPANFQPHGPESLIAPFVVQPEQALESGFYLSDRFDVSQRLSITVGLRYSLYTYLGPKDVYVYPPGVSKEETSIRDTLSYSSGKGISTYHGPEYRLSARYSLSDNASVKVSYNRMRQYIHMLSNTAVISPTDIWKLSDPNIKPQVGDQYSIGFYKNLKNNTIETSIEGYYKTIDHFMDYKSGAELILNKHIETDVINTEGLAYGVELMVKKLTGRVNGWVSYTYSRSLLRMRDPVSVEVINKGKYYPSNYDKPHDFTFIGNYRFNKRFSTSVNFTYSTGRPITLPLGKYDMIGSKRVYYSERNQERIPDYIRADFSMNIEGSHKVKKLSHSSWTIAVYNLLGRKNAYSIFFKTENGAIKGYKLSIFGQPIPTITYNFKF
jgi:acylphosphatase